MHFKYGMTARGVWLDERGLPAEFTVGKVTVTLRLPDAAEQEQGFDRRNAQCDALKVLDPNPRVVEGLSALIDNRLPEDSEEREQWSQDYEFIDETGRLLGNHMHRGRSCPSASGAS